jgi:hypothetical protein
LHECAEDDRGCGSQQQKERRKMNEEKDVSKTDADRENEVRDLEPAKDAKGGGGFKPVSGGGGGGKQIPPSPPPTSG